MLLLLSVVAAVAFSRSVQETAEEKNQDITQHLEAMDGTYVSFTLSSIYLCVHPTFTYLFTTWKTIGFLPHEREIQ